MNSTSRLVLLLAFVSLIPIGAGAAGDEVHYELHEWGVFTAPRGALWLQQDMIAEWQSFPAFFHGVLPGRQLAYRGPVNKPVIFLHGESKHPVQVTLQFTAGRPLIWWPPAEYPAAGIGDWGRAEENSLSFQVNLGEQLAEPMKVAKGHWVEDLRKVRSTPFSGYGSAWPEGRMDNESWTENFLYYDGLMKRPRPPEVERGEKGIILRTDSDHPWLDVLVIDRSVDGSKVSLGRLPEIAAGERETAVPLAQADAAEVEALPAVLKRKLVAVGLHDDEAQSLLDLWSEGLFERTGLSLCYRLPEEVYDEWIALHCQPKPKKVVRVGLVLHEHLEPELAETVETLVVQLGADKVQERNRAEQQLRGIGGAAFEALQRIAKGNDPESATRAREILEDLKAAEELQALMMRHQKNRLEGGKE